MLALKCLSFPSLRTAALLCAGSMLALLAEHRHSYAQDFNRERSTVPLQAGDILLVPLNCYVCNAIEKETGVPYSHSVVVAHSSNELSSIDVYEAWGTSRKTPLLEIIKRAEKKQRLFHMRPREFAERGAPSEKEIAALFERRFATTLFDDEFLWNNVDERGIEKIYCAEFVVKFINVFLNDPQPPEPMRFGRLKEFWQKYYQQFNLDIPEGQPGASPALIYSSERFLKLGELETLKTESPEIP